jgi:demethylmenaquinone methyltransferase/2-methoxy-6-polyprenyl-1,4-benzoquinol methylase
MANNHYTHFEFTGSIVRHYDRFNHLATFGLDRLWRFKTARYIKDFLCDINCPQRVLDLACGTGDMAIAVRKQCHSADIFAVDPAPEMLELFIEKTPEDIAIIRAVDDLPFSSASFHAVTCAFGYRNFTRLQKNLRELNRVLATEGRIYALDFFRPDNRFSKIFLKLYQLSMIRFIGFVLNRKIAPYDYLYKSIVGFYSAAEFCDVLTHANFRILSKKPFFLGLAHLIEAEKNTSIIK